MVSYVFKKFDKRVSLKCKIFRSYSNPILLKFKGNNNLGILKDEDILNLFMGFVSLLKKSIRVVGVAPGSFNASGLE